MLTVPEQFSGATRATLESQLAIFAALTGKVFENAEKIADLNLNAAKATLEDNTALTHLLLEARDPQEALSLAAAQIQPTAAKSLAYSRQLVGLVTTVQAEFVHILEEQLAETGRKVSEMVDDVSKNAPAGSENVIALFRTAIGTANAGYEQFSKTTRQAAEAMEANMSSVASQFTQGTAKTATRGRK